MSTKSTGYERLVTDLITLWNESETAALLGNPGRPKKLEDRVIEELDMLRGDLRAHRDQRDAIRKEIDRMEALLHVVQVFGPWGREEALKYIDYKLLPELKSCYVPPDEDVVAAWEAAVEYAKVDPTVKRKGSRGANAHRLLMALRRSQGIPFKDLEEQYPGKNISRDKDEGLDLGRKLGLPELPVSSSS